MVVAYKGMCRIVLFLVLYSCWNLCWSLYGCWWGYVSRIAMILRVEISLRNLQNYCENCW